MRKIMMLAVAVAAVFVPVTLAGTVLRSYAQVTAPQGDEFNSNVFSAPFHLICGAFAPNCPDPQSATTWSLDGSISPGVLRIWTLPGSLMGTAAQASNNARNLVVQPFNPAVDFVATTSVRFPSVLTNSTPLGQTAGMIVYQGDDDFIFVGRTVTATGTQLEFVQEQGGFDTINTMNESSTAILGQLYLRITKVGSLYQASWSPDNITFFPIAPGVVPVATATPAPTATGTPAPTATSTPLPTGYVATYASPQIGLFGWGGTNAAVSVASNQIPADFDWFRVGNSATPAATPLPTATNTPVATSTALPTNTPVATSTAVPTSTSTPVPTSTTVPTATPTPTPTPTPVPVHHRYVLSFKFVSLWYHAVRPGTFDHVDVQANHSSQLGIWMHVIFPSGAHHDYFENTSTTGSWSKTFSVPKNALSPYSNIGYVLLQLWHHKTTVQHWLPFTVVR